MYAHGRQTTHAAGARTHYAVPKKHWVKVAMK
jgi:hypothetical protein